MFVCATRNWLHQTMFPVKYMYMKLLIYFKAITVFNVTEFQIKEMMVKICKLRNLTILNTAEKIKFNHKN